METTSLDSNPTHAQPLKDTQTLTSLVAMTKTTMARLKLEMHSLMTQHNGLTSTATGLEIIQTELNPITARLKSELQLSMSSDVLMKTGMEPVTPTTCGLTTDHSGLTATATDLETMLLEPTETHVLKNSVFPRLETTLVVLILTVTSTPITKMISPMRRPSGLMLMAMVMETTTPQVLFGRTIGLMTLHVMLLKDTSRALRTNSNWT